MINKILERYKNFDKITFKILKYGLFFCFALYVINSAIFLTYIFNGHSPILFEIGISLLKLNNFYTMSFIICSFLCDSIKKQLI